MGRTTRHGLFSPQKKGVSGILNRLGNKIIGGVLRRKSPQDSSVDQKAVAQKLSMSPQNVSPSPSSWTVPVGVQTSVAPPSQPAKPLNFKLPRPAIIKKTEQEMVAQLIDSKVAKNPYYQKLSDHAQLLDKKAQLELASNRYHAVYEEYANMPEDSYGQKDSKGNDVADANRDVEQLKRNIQQLEKAFKQKHAPSLTAEQQNMKQAYQQKYDKMNKLDTFIQDQNTYKESLERDLQNLTGGLKRSDSEDAWGHDSGGALGARADVNTYELDAKVQTINEKIAQLEMITYDTQKLRDETNREISDLHHTISHFSDAKTGLPQNLSEAYQQMGQIRQQYQPTPEELANIRAELQKT